MFSHAPRKTLASFVYVCVSSSSIRTSDGQSSLADKCCGPLQIREAAVELLGLQGWLGPGPHSQFFIQLTPFVECVQQSALLLHRGTGQCLLL